ncbi:ABC transporter ATP-binding protein [Glaciimonas sp. PCH181]|uniref:ABC transporter ATP-binding protein n=1 Tax=Glaciimonas sp. PCH181 TaxID=2133943 RepID=UPI000D38FEA2|nr:ABC transporter ATP-binding protein [Glaciimonas sp. PCH181]PUA17881.1 polyamine ABC transporter ATP-binding protein [Glaciimonas sp. PCH181]
MSNSLVIENICKEFGTGAGVTQVVKNINLTIPEGKMVCFLGPSGCGKTTLLRMIAGLEIPTSGRMRMADRDLTDVPACERDFGMVFQSLALFPHMTVAANIAYPLKLRGVDKAGQAKRVSELLQLIQLQHMTNRPVAQLSGGQRQRVAIARALASAPKLLLLDEPLSALDAKLREAMQVEIRQLQQRLGITAIMVTHDQREAMTMADVIVVMEHGRIAQIGTPLEVYRNPVNEFVADFIGLGNILEAQPSGLNCVQLAGGQQIQIQSTDKPTRSFALGQEIRLLIRPEDVCLQMDQENRATENCIAGEVSFIRDVGSSLEATINCSGFELTIAASPRDVPGLMLGMSVVARLPPQSCKLIDATPRLQ